MHHCKGCYNKGLLLIRLWLGITMAIHGAQGIMYGKEGRVMGAQAVFGTGISEGLATVLGALAAGIMLVGGIAFALGIARRTACFALGVVMLAAGFSHFKAGQWLFDPGGPRAAMNLAIVFFGLIGVQPGRRSLSARRCCKKDACCNDTKECGTEKPDGCCGGGCCDHEKRAMQQHQHHQQQ